jgi:hypothetical protein
MAFKHRQRPKRIYDEYKVKTIDYYIYQEFRGDCHISDFPIWYSSKTILAPIKGQLDDLVSQMLETKWLEEPKREHLRKQIRDCISDFIAGMSKQSPSTIYQSWIQEMSPFCFQGGFGHSFTYPHCPHHWVIRPEHYAAKGQIPEIVEIAACVLGYEISISRVAQVEIWGS